VFVVTNGNQHAKYDYNPQSRYRYATFPSATSDTTELIRQALPLVEKLYQPGIKYLKAGVILSGLVPDQAIQSSLFAGSRGNRQRFLMEAMDNINFSQRDDIVKYAASGLKRNWKMRQEMRSRPRYTTRWDELFEIS
jgi:DNA polymerase V